MTVRSGAEFRDLSCDEVVERLPALVAGDLDDLQIAEIEQHTSDCFECDVDLRQSRGLSNALQQLWSERLHALKNHLDTAESVASHVNGIGTPEASAPTDFTARIHSALDRVASYAPVETDFGVIHLVATDKGLARVFFPDVDEPQIDYWCRAHDLVPLVDEESIDPFAEQIQEYLEGRRTNFDMPLDLRTVTPFMRGVLNALREIPYGEVRNYRQIAGQIGNPNAQRAVGNAVKRNPVPIVVPCHRVIRTDGHIGGYAGGPFIKERLLKLEGALLAS